MKISDLCAQFKLEYFGSDVDINGLNLIGRASSKDAILTYATSGKYKKRVATDISVKALLVDAKTKEEYLEVLLMRDGCVIISDNPEQVFYEIHDYLIRLDNFYKPVVLERKISSTAIIHPTAVIEDYVIIEDDVKIGAFSFIRAGTIIRRGSTIGNHTTIGAEGCQVLRIDGIPTKIKHCGGVLIEEGVSIGDHCSVCNTLFDGFTRVGAYSQIDNFCHIAHYVNIGKRVIMTPGITLVGSVTIEDDCYIGAGATIMNKAIIHTGATVGIGSVVMQNVNAGTTVFGNPAKQIF